MRAHALRLVVGVEEAAAASACAAAVGVEVRAVSMVRVGVSKAVRSGDTAQGLIKPTLTSLSIQGDMCGRRRGGGRRRGERKRGRNGEL